MLLEALNLKEIKRAGIVKNLKLFINEWN